MRQIEREAIPHGALEGEDAVANLGLLVRLTPRRVGRLLGLIILGLTTIHIVLEAIFLAFDTPFIFGLRPLFNLDREANIPTYFSGLQLLLAAILLVGVGLTAKHQGAPHHRRWWALAGVLTFMSVDEVAQIHEKVSAFMYRLPSATDALGGRAWIFAGLILVAIVGAYFVPFLMSLPSRTRWGYIISGGLFVFAAVGVELIEALWQRNGGHVPGYLLIATAQEFFEMAAIAYFIVVTIRHSSTIGMHLVIRAD